MDAPARLEGGFDDPVLAAQSVFRAVMNALARPGTPQAFATLPEPPAPLTPGLAAVALTLADHDTALWLDPVLAGADEAVAWLRFHTGALVTGDPGAAAFALMSGLDGLLPFDRFALGTDEYPDRSVTVVVEAIAGDGGPLLAGPGIEATARLGIAGLPPGFTTAWSANRGLFPRGVDLLFVTGSEVVGLPRSTRIVEPG